MKLEPKILGVELDLTLKSHMTKQILALIPSCLISICSGMTFGITAVMLPQLREDKTISYNAAHESWIASISSLFMIISSLSSGHILDRYGRKTAHILVGIPYIIGWMAIAFARNTSVIIIGRIFTGLGSGANKAIMLVYIGEIANPKIRSIFLFVPSILLNIGVLASHLFAYYLHWKISSYICLVPSILITVTSLFLKESPLWLISKGRIEEGIETFRWLRGTDEASEAELKTALERQSEKPNISAKETLKIISSSAFIKPMLTLIVVVVNIQLTGVTVLGFYSQDVFRETFSGDIDPFIMMIVMDCLVGVVSVAVCFFGKFVSKKRSFLLSNLGVGVFVAGLVACLKLGYEGFIWLPVTCLILFLCFSTGVLTIGWAFVPELLPSNVRGIGSGINSSFAWTFLFILVKETPAIMKSYGPSAVFGSYGVTAFVCGFVLYFILPDTEGKTLQSIEDDYNKKVESTAL